MTNDHQQKIKAIHLSRPAYLYVRQSTLKQVLENTEGKARQYDLRGRAVSLGWPADRIVVIDSDLGQSGASAADRKGFQRLIADVSLGRVGVVMGLEVSRLARNSSDWHRLVEICAVTETLILDEDGVYDPNFFNDHLLLGLKGQMSEVELHLLRSRMRGALLNKARRGELSIPLPVGLAYTPDGRVVLDPDIRVQESVRAVFEMFGRTGAAYATLRAIEQQGIRLPHRIRTGRRKGELVWNEPDLGTIIRFLHNPRYAGAYAYGRTKYRLLPDGSHSLKKVSRDDWICLMRDAHPGYISWDQFEENEKQLLQNARSRISERQSPPREGPALLQGLILCGVCGHRMSVAYKQRQGHQVPEYSCGWEHSAKGGAWCQHFMGDRIDHAMGELLVELMTPATLDVALSVHQEIQARLEEADRLRRRQVEQAQYEADAARHRFMQVDPNNRLVADELESEWNRKLRDLRDAQEGYERRRELDRIDLTDARREAVLRLSSDFPKVWNSPDTPHRERKRLVRLMVEDVTLLRVKQMVTVHVRLRGGATRTLQVRLRRSGFLEHEADPALIAELDRLLNDHEDVEIATILNGRGFRSGTGRSLTEALIKQLRNSHHLTSRHERLHATGLVTQIELAAQFGVRPTTIVNWTRQGRLQVVRGGGRGHTILYKPVDPSVVERFRRSRAR